MEMNILLIYATIFLNEHCSEGKFMINQYLSSIQKMRKSGNLQSAEEALNVQINFGMVDRELLLEYSYIYFLKKEYSYSCAFIAAASYYIVNYANQFGVVAYQGRIPNGLKDKIESTGENPKYATIVLDNELLFVYYLNIADKLNSVNKEDIQETRDLFATYLNTNRMNAKLKNVYDSFSVNNDLKIQLLMSLLKIQKSTIIGDFAYTLFFRFMM